MNCMADLLAYRDKLTTSGAWYLINLCGKELPLAGKELPLATNREMVVKFQRLNGSSSIIT